MFCLSIYFKSNTISIHKDLLIPRNGNGGSIFFVQRISRIAIPFKILNSLI